MAGSSRRFAKSRGKQEQGTGDPSFRSAVEEQTQNPGLAYTHTDDLYNDLDARDEEGTELPDDGAARERAIGERRTMAPASVAEGHLVRSHRIETWREDGSVIAGMRFDGR